jgi:hypothetical protein
MALGLLSFQPQLTALLLEMLSVAFMDLLF